MERNHQHNHSAIRCVELKNKRGYLMEKIFRIEKKKNLIVTSDYIALSNNRFKDYSEMKKNSEMISLKEDFQIINKKDLYRIVFNEKGNTIKLNYASEAEVNDMIKLIPSDNSELKELADSIGSIFEMELKKKTENRAKYLTFNSIKILFVCLFSYLIVTASINMQHGTEYEFSGRRKGLSKLFMSFIDTIGPIGTSIICVLVIGYYSYKLIKRYKNPAIDFEFKKVIQKTT